MTDIIEDTNPRKLTDLVKEVHDGKNVLPEFQRQFVWEPGFIAELLNSIRHGYPAGSILRMRYPPEEFQHRKFDYVNEAIDDSPIFLILDGQQRLTSLHNAYYGVGKHIFFLDVVKLLNGDEFSNAIFWKTENSTGAKKLQETEEQIKNLVVPFSYLFSSDFDDWIHYATENKKFKFTEDSHAYRKKLKNAIAPIKSAFENYQFPVVSLKQDTSLEAICTIFETINNTGVRLSVFDLLTARFYPRKINLPDLWDQAIGDYRILDEFDVNPYYILQTISALTTSPHRVERPYVLALKANDFERHWQNACKAFSDVLIMLQSDCGVISKKWLPYGTVLVTLSTVVCLRPIDKGPAVAERKRNLCRFFWKATIGTYYEKNTGARIANDVPKLLALVDKGHDEFKVDLEDISEDAILQTTPKQRAFYKTIMCALISNETRDLHTGNPISSHYMHERKIDDHHIFPLKFLSEKYLNKSLTSRRNAPDKFENIVNRILIDSDTNRAISSKAPSRYFGNIMTKQTEEIRRNIWKSHFIDDEAVNAMLEDDFELFCSIRVKSIHRRLRELLK